MVAKPPARIATLDMAAELLGTARLNRAHRPVLHRSEAVCGLIRRAVACEDLGQFELYPCRIRAVRMRAHRALETCSVRALQQIEWRGCFRQVRLRQMEIARRSVQAAVTHQPLNPMHVHARFQQMSGEGVAQPVNATILGNAGAVLGGAIDTLRRLHR